MTASVSAVAIDADGLVVDVLPMSRGLSYSRIHVWAEDRRDQGYRVAALPFVPTPGVVVAESLRREVSHA